MGDEQNPSLSTKLLSVSFFALLAILSLAWFFISITGIFSQFRFNEAVISFDKGSMYMLGVGIGLISLAVGGLMQGIFGQELTPKRESLFKRSLVVSILAMVVLPQSTQYFVDNYARKRNYVICNEATYQWLLYGKYYYTDSKITCAQLVKAKA